MRSSTPPWPGIRFDESFTPALRFSSDSNRSPTMPSSEIAAPSSAEQPDRRGEHVAAADRHRQRAEHHPADRSLDGLLRADRRRQRPSAERAAGVVLRRVADDDDRQQQQRRPRGRHLAADAPEPPQARRAAGRCRSARRAWRRRRRAQPVPDARARPSIAPATMKPIAISTRYTTLGSSKREPVRQTTSVGRSASHIA